MTHILIDGYNFLPATDFSGRDPLVAALALYRKTRGHEITVVFDGTHQGTGSGDRSFSSGIEVIFSPITVTADEVIESMLPRMEPSSTLVVSSDRRIQDAARRAGATFVSSQEFARRLNAPPSPIINDADPGPSKPKRGNPRKLSKEERKRRKVLTRL